MEEILTIRLQGRGRRLERRAKARSLGEPTGAAGARAGRIADEPGVGPYRTPAAGTTQGIYTDDDVFAIVVTIVLDTNVIVAALVAKGLCHEVVVRSLAASMVATSTPLLDELEWTLRAKFTLGPAASAFLEQLRARVRLVDRRRFPDRCRATPTADLMATAVAARAAAIITGGQDLLILGRSRDIDILSPREFLTRLP